VLDQVYDYEAMGRPYKPRCLHRTDCPHVAVNVGSPTQFRKATPDELTRLPECRDCARREQQNTHRG
jgi:hypothetical protein